MGGHQVHGVVLRPLLDRGAWEPDARFLGGVEAGVEVLEGSGEAFEVLVIPCRGDVDVDGRWNGEIVELAAMPPTTTYRTPCPLRTRTIAEASRSGIDSMSRQSCSLALVLTLELVGGQQPLGGGERRGVGVGWSESHADLEAGGGEQPAEGVDRCRAATGLVGRYRWLAGAGAPGDVWLRPVR